MELPLDIMFDIFSRLPIETVLASKLVSKNWRDVVHHPSFSQKHLNRLCSSEDSGNLGFLFTDYTNSDSKEFYYVEYDENNETPIISTRRINIPSELKSYTVVGCCNGLICLYELSSIIICNPITREYVDLPRLNCYFFLRCGFGYLVSTNEYKVVRVYELPGEPSSVEVEVYTLGSGNGWRNVGKLNSEYGLLCDQVGVFANGALHWAVSRKRIIVAFDLAYEKFREIQLPTFPECLYRDGYFKLVGSLGDYLMCLDYMKLRRSLDIWLLKENSTTDMNREVDYKSMSWGKKFHVGNMEPFSFTNSGAVLCFNTRPGKPTLYGYDLKSSSFEMLVSFDKIFIQPPFVHMKTIVSLKALGEENTNRMETNG